MFGGDSLLGSVLGFLVYVSLATGCAPFTLQRSRIVLLRYSGLYCSAHFVIVFSIMVNYFFWWNSMFVDDFHIEYMSSRYISYYVLYSTMLCTSTLKPLAMYINRRHMCACVQRLISFDVLLRRRGGVHNYRAMQLVLAVFVADFFLNCYVFLLSFTFAASAHVPVVVRTLAIVIKIVVEAILMQVLLIFAYLRYAFAHLNGQLAVSATNARQFIDLCLMHNRLIEISNKFRAGFSRQMFTLCSGFIFYNVGLMLVWVYEESDIYVLERILQVSFLYVSRAFLFFYFASKASEQAERTSRVIHSMQFKDMDMRSQVQSFSLKMLQQRIIYSALGFYTLTFSTFYQLMLAILNSYFIMGLLKQWEETPLVAAPKDNVTIFGNVTLTA